MIEDWHPEPLGFVRSPRLEPLDDGWGAVVATIDLDPSRLEPTATAGLDAFSHIEVVFVFHRATSEQTGARRPRGNPDWPEVGILAQRGKGRPNRIGVTTCELRDVSGLRVTVAGLDAIDGTPVLDIKPYLAEFGPRGPVRQPDWSHDLMRQYW
jgi:tRNA-Thr(GGU) m(6)t(6)A37 methyltransferase TsaA